MNTSVLLTRAKSANAVLQQQLIQHELEFIECSLLQYKFPKFNFDILHQYSHIVITSSFAAKNLPKYITNKYINAWVVGEQTKNILESRGYTIKFCAPDAISLNQELQKNIHIKAVYLSGNNITLAMPSNVRRIVFYYTQYTQYLTWSKIKRLRMGVDYILLYSKNCANTLLYLLSKHNLLKYLISTTIITFTFRIATIINDYFKNIINFTHSNQIIEFLANINDK